MHTAYYAFLKQAKLWELHNAVPQPDPEAERASQFAEQPILAFSNEAKQPATAPAQQRRRAA
jgi:hypothetical protein